MANIGLTRVFCSYAHADADIRNELAKHLNLLQEGGVIQVWHDGAIAAGEEWEKQILEQMQAADVILLLVSIDLLNSTFVKGHELPLALKRHKDGTAIVLPVIIRPVSWSLSGLNFLQALPEDLRPVIMWSPRDSAYVNICEGLLKAILSWRGGDPRRGDDRGSVRSVTRRRVLDVGLPREVPFLKPTVLAIMIRRPDQPGLRGAFELQTRYSLKPEEVESACLRLTFPKSEGKFDPVDLTVCIETTDFKCIVKEKRLAVPPHGDSPIVVFIMEALRIGSLVANVSISQAGRRIAELLLHTNGIDGSVFRPEVQHSVALEISAPGPTAGAPAPPKRDMMPSRAAEIPNRKTKREVVAISVQFDVNSPDRLSRALIRLDKHTDDRNAAAWNMNYSLLERNKKADSFDDPIAQVEVDVQPSLYAKAEKAATKGLTVTQAAYAIGTTANQVKRYVAGKLTPVQAKKSVEDILRQP